MAMVETGRSEAHVGAAAGQPPGRIEDDVAPPGCGRCAAARAWGATVRQATHVRAGVRRGALADRAAVLAAAATTPPPRRRGLRPRPRLGLLRGARLGLVGGCRLSAAAAFALVAAASPGCGLALAAAGLALARRSSALRSPAALRLRGCASAWPAASAASVAFGLCCDALRPGLRRAVGSTAAPHRRRRLARRLGGGRLGRGWASAAALASATDTSLRMSIRQPVSRAASRAFCPSRPIASESIRSGTVTTAMRCSSSMSTERTCAGLRALATNTPASSLHGMTSIFSPASSATTAWTRAPRWPTVAPTGSRPSWRDDDRDLRAAARLAGDGLDLDRAAVDLGNLELEQPAQEALVRAADEDLRPAHGAPDLEHERLDVLPDAVVLEGALLGRGEDRLDVLADVEDDRRAARPG